MDSTSAQATSSAQASHSEATSTAKPKTTFLTLPTDIRLEIYDWVLYSTTLYAKDTEKFAVVRVPTPEGIDPEDAVNDTAREVEIFRSPVMTEQLNLICRLFNDEIAQSWHSKVTYHFPCSVAFLDVLGQWPPAKVRTIRHAHIEGYPIPLFPIDDPGCYMTHFIPDVLPIFPTLRLNTLTVENIWLHPSGAEVDGWCLGATSAEVRNLLVSGGWKKLKYLSGTLGFLSGNVREIEQTVAAMKEKRGEARFTYTLSAMRPRLSHLVHTDINGNTTSEDTDHEKAEVAQWKAEHPKPREKPTEKRIQVWATRGIDDYEPKVEDRTEHIKGLMERLSWIELRKAGGFLVDDDTEDFVAHL